MSNAYINFTFESKTDWVKKINECQKEIKILKEEYMMLQNASDKVEEEKDKEIERLNNIIKEVREYIKETQYDLDTSIVYGEKERLDLEEILKILDKKNNNEGDK